MKRTRKAALVTGGTSGIGRALVHELGKRDFAVYFVGTNMDKGRAVETELGQGEGRFIPVDLSDLRATRAFAVRFAAEHEQLDLLVNVAGVMLPERQETPEGNERTFTIDHLAAFVLSHELAPALARAEHGRIANVSGPPRQMLPPSLNFDDLQLARDYSLVRSVTNAVHAKTVMTEILAEKYRSAGVDVIAFDPGPVKTDLSRHMDFPLNLLFRAATSLMPRSSKTAVYATSSAELEGVSGQLVTGRKLRELRFDERYKARLWDATLAALPFELPA